MRLLGKVKNENRKIILCESEIYINEKKFGEHRLS